MKKYIIKYITKDDDLCTIWVEASSKKEAKSEAKQEYWDIKEIISCSEK